MEEIISNIPALKPPPGVTPNIENPPNLMVICFTFLVVMFIVILLAVSTRIYTKAIVIGKLALEDCK